jgi:hypothetical protein
MGQEWPKTPTLPATPTLTISYRCTAWAIPTGLAPIDYSPVLLLMPFGFHLTMDTLPSGDPQVGGFRSALACFRLSLSCPCRLLHTSHLLRPARHYPRVRIWHSSSERQRDFSPPERRAAQRTPCSSPTTGRGAASRFACAYRVTSSGATGDPASPPEVTRHSSVPCRPQSPCFWWVNENAFASL